MSTGLDPRNPPTGLSVEEATLSAAGVDAFVGALGGRDRLVEILLIGCGDPAVDRVIALLDDPTLRGWSLRKICRHAALTVADFLRAYERAMIARGEIASARVIAHGIVAVVEDVMRRAAPYDEPCPCGAPEVTSPTSCKACRGTGILHLLPDLGRQKVALELGKLLTPGALMQQNVMNVSQSQMPAAAAPSSGSLADLQAAVHEILHPRRVLTLVPPAQPPPVVEATLLEEDPGA